MTCLAAAVLENRNRDVNHISSSSAVLHQALQAGNVTKRGGCIYAGRRDAWHASVSING